MKKSLAVFVSAYISFVVFTLLYIPEYFVENPFNLLEFVGYFALFGAGYGVYLFIQNKRNKRKQSTKT